MTIASDIFSRVRALNLDSAGVRWDDAELLDWLNDGQKDVVWYKPTANAVVTSITLVAGVWQAIPAGGIQLLEITHNDNGPAVRLIEKEDLDAVEPGWYTATPAAEVVHYMFNEDDTKAFLVYPPQPGTPGTVQGRYSTVPTELAAAGDTVTLADEYIPVLVDYLLYRVYQKHSKHAGNVQRSQNARARFLEALGVKTRADLAFSPNRDRENAANSV